MAGSPSTRSAGHFYLNIVTLDSHIGSCLCRSDFSRKAVGKKWDRVEVWHEAEAVVAPGGRRFFGGDLAVCLDRPSTADGPDSRLMLYWGGQWIGGGGSALAVSFTELIC